MVKWQKADLEKYKQAKEYIDTVIIPLQPFQIKQESKLEKEAFQREILALLLNEIEKELSGRILLIPEFNYLKSTVESDGLKLNDWIEELTQQPFKTVILMTFDPDWKKIEDKLNGELVWFPGIHSGDLKSKEMKMILKSQVEQINELIRSYW